MRSRFLFLTLFVITLGACASGGGSALYRRDVGNASLTDAMDRSELILARNQYEIEATDSIPFIRIETRWRPRAPFQDELALGITSAESRVIVTGRVRGETEVGSVYNVQLVVENRVRVAGGPEWNLNTNTAMFRGYADVMAEQLKTEFTNIGVRRFGG
jgi:hypothetical protein